MADERHPSPAEETRRLYEETENRSARAFEQLVARDSFGELLAKVTENVVGLTKISTDVFDLVLRNLRLAGRQDIIRLSRQLARTEDKLEHLLQEVERLQDASSSGSRRASSSSSSNGRGSGGTRRASRRSGSRS
jgi:uncharacterized membrane protein YgcG